MHVTTVPRAEAFAAVSQRVKETEVVLDLGAGIRPQTFVGEPLVHLCVEPHRTYVERLRADVRNDPRIVILNGTWEQATALLPDKCVDSVFALDFIEHLEKEEGFRMLREAERLARVQIVVYTPNGFFPQNHAGSTDRWGLDGAAWQVHRSGWTAEDFGPEWHFVVSPDFIELDEHNQPMEQPMGALWAFRELGEPSERRYLLMKDPSAANLGKRALKRLIPGFLWRSLRSVWLPVRRVFLSAARVRRSGR
jgi:hypothetical protein